MSQISAIYEAIGRLVVEFVRRRYRRELRLAGAAAAATFVVGVGAWAASRELGED